MNGTFNVKRITPVTSLCTLPMPMRVLFSVFLITVGIGCVMALFYLFLMDVEPHRKMGMGLVAAITVKYRDAREHSPRGRRQRSDGG